MNFRSKLKLLILLHADDTVILSESPDDFQNSLNVFHNYCNQWHLTVNLTKTKVVVVGARNINALSFKLGDSPITITDKYHYLGVTFSSSGSFLAARKHVVQQANKALFQRYTK